MGKTGRKEQADNCNGLRDMQKAAKRIEKAYASRRDVQFY